MEIMRQDLSFIALASMIRPAFILLIASAVSFSHGQVAISGTVQDSRTKAPVPGAHLELTVSDLVATADAEGKFIITGSPPLRTEGGRNAPVPRIDPGPMRYRHDAEGPVLIRVFDLSGNRRSVIFSGMLAAGSWHVVPPRLSPGMYFCTFETPESRRVIRFLASIRSNGTKAGMVRVANRDSDRYAARKRRDDSVPIDSLRVTKAGYRQAVIPIDAYVLTDMTVLLDDSASLDYDDATIVPDPSWTCYMPEGIPPPTSGDAVFRIALRYSAIHDVGITRFGHRRQLDIESGTITGDRIEGTVLTGGLDYELILSNGSIELEQIVILRAENSHILMRNAGVAPSGTGRVRLVLDFEAPNSSPFTWLHTGKFVAERVVDSAEKTVILDVYDVSGAVPAESRVQIRDPAGVPNQTWECLKLTGTQGATVFTENVTLGSSISIGASKRGSRNIIPITGGTTSGRVKGKILPGGADYQLGGLDARYTLAPDDGEFIIVRNCGSGALVPVFEARADGPYAFLNEDKYLSSGPGKGSGGVTITFYERK